MAITKKYIEATGKDCNRLEVTLDYSLGGYNYWNGNTDGRGYYLYVSPVTITSREYNGRPYETVSQVLGQGIKKLVKPVQRRSKKAEAEAAINAEAEAVKVVGAAVDTMRTQINNVTAARTSLNENRKDKLSRVKAENLCEQAFSAITEEYRNSLKLLEEKDKHKITVKEATDIESILKKEVASLRELIAKVKSENSLGGKLRGWLNDLMEDDN
jgi:hypothetical protein